MNGNGKPIATEAPRYVSIQEGARYSGLSFWTFREYVSEGLIPSIRLPHAYEPGKELRRILVDTRDIDEFMQANKTRKSS